jgi:type I restriction enzyme S subunit
MQRERVGALLRLQRRPVRIDPFDDYVEVGVRSFGRGIFHKEPVEGASLGSKRVFRIEPDDLVISNVFAWEGAIAVASNEDAGTIGSHRFMTFVPTDDRIDIRWASWFFRSEPGLDLIRKASPGSAGRNRTLAIDRFEALEIPLPPLDEQRHVAGHLDHVEHRATLAAGQLDRQDAGMLLRHMPALLGAVVARAASGCITVSQLVDFVSDTVHPGDDPSPADCFVGLQHIESHTGTRIGADDLPALDGRKFRFRPGDVIYGYLRPYLNKVWLADRHGLCSVDQYVLRPRGGGSAPLLAYLLRTEEVLQQAAGLTHNLQLPRLRSGLLASIEVPAVPDTAVSAVLARLVHIQDSVTRAVALRARQERLAASLVPAALNEAFAGLS